MDTLQVDVLLSVGLFCMQMSAISSNQHHKSEFTCFDHLDIMLLIWMSIALVRLGGSEKQERGTDNSYEFLRSGTFFRTPNKQFSKTVAEIGNNLPAVTIHFQSHSIRDSP